MADFKLEAEDLISVKGYRIENNAIASGDSLLGLKGRSAGEVGSATFAFRGDAGIYDIIVGTFDENDGAARFELTRGGSELGQIVLDRNLGGAIVSTGTRVERTIASSVAIADGDRFTLTGFENGLEPARFDFVRFVQTGAQVRNVQKPVSASLASANNSGSSGKLPVFLSSDGTIVIEAEVAEPKGFWVKETIANRDALLFDGPNSTFRTVRRDQQLEYRFKTDVGGNYFIALYGARDNTVMDDFARDKGNDVFVGVENVETGEVIQAGTKLSTYFGASNLTYLWGTTFSADEERVPTKVELEANTEYRLLVTGRSDGYAVDRITLRQGRFFRDADAPQSKTESPPAPPKPKTVVLEAEDADISGSYRVENSRFASGKQVLGFTRGRTNERGRATFGFDDTPGTYDVILGTFDESDGIAKFVVSLTDAETGTKTRFNVVKLDDDLGSSLPTAQTAVLRTAAAGISLTRGDTISVIGVENKNEPARLDFLQLVPSVV